MGSQVGEKRRFDKLRRPFIRAWNAITRPQCRQTPPAVNNSRTARPQPESRLPPELLDQIIDNLHNDKDSLRACSLVCRSLVSSARFHLFRTILIRDDNYKRMVSLFVDTAPGLALFVRNLTLEHGGLDETFKHLQRIMEGKEAKSLLRSFIQIIVPRTKNVQRLTLKDVPLDNSIVDMLAPHLPQLDTLSLFDCWFRCNADLDKLVRDHPAIHTIRCGRVSSLYGFSPPDTDERIGSPLVLQQLKITEAYSPSPLTLMPWLVTHCNPDHFIYTVYRLSQVTKLNQSIMELESLKHLHIIFYRWRNPDLHEAETSPEVLSLFPHHPPSVTTLTVDGKTYMMYLVIVTMGHLDPHLFVKLRTINLYIHLKVSEVARIPDHAWAAMDQTLSVLLSLGVVNLYNTCVETKHLVDGQHAIEERLPVLHARKLLNFQFQPAPF
ncbi:hypothetical protein C8Q80DRAFT_1267382 [Daedaleopsis nitida]|nr:hypothetical protein C8Q80DRAFT_1267382 [Daedaleopsis nitida]